MPVYILEGGFAGGFAEMHSCDLQMAWHEFCSCCLSKGLF